MPRRRTRSEFERLLLPHLDAAYNLACWLLRDAHEAEDAVQESYLKAYQAFGQYRGGSDAAWLLQIVRNTSISMLRKRKARGNVIVLKELFSAGDPALEAALQDVGAGPERQLLAKGEQEVVQRALGRLSEIFREVIVLHKPAVWERWAVSAATHLCAMLIGLGLGYWVLLSATEHDYLTRELLAAHVRSLMQERPVDVASGDPHRVAPWFAGKLDFAPKVEDLATQGYPLQGGRVDYFQGRRVAVLIFQRRAHVINVFVTPHAGGPLPTSEWRRDGYNIARWGNGEFTFWAISDLNADELDQLARLLGAQ